MGYNCPRREALSKALGGKGYVTLTVPLYFLLFMIHGLSLLINIFHAGLIL